MQVTARQAGATTVLDVVGDIDLYNSPELRKALLGALRANHAPGQPPRVVVNLKAVRYIDSSGVASLVEGLKASREAGSRLILYGLSPAAREVLELSRLITLFEVYEDEARALGS